MFVLWNNCSAALVVLCDEDFTTSVLACTATSTVSTRRNTTYKIQEHYSLVGNLPSCGLDVPCTFDRWWLLLANLIDQFFSGKLQWFYSIWKERPQRRLTLGNCVAVLFTKSYERKRSSWRTPLLAKVVAPTGFYKKQLRCVLGW